VNRSKTVVLVLPQGRLIYISTQLTVVFKTTVTVLETTYTDYFRLRFFLAIFAERLIFVFKLTNSVCSQSKAEKLIYTVAPWVIPCIKRCLCSPIVRGIAPEAV